MPKTAVLILAAGASSRMGKIKALLPWKDSTLLGHAVANAQKVSDQVLVVLGAKHEQILPALPKKVKSLVNADWPSGMGSSIARGIAALEKIGHPQSILISLVDQPLIDGDYLKQMILTAEKFPQSIVATQYGDRAGVPALFPKAFFGELKQLKGDFGAKQLLRHRKDAVIVMDASKKEVDLDSPEVYKAFWTRYGQ